ncbi:MAG: ATP-binding protein [Lachnospiraceae bacterium]
MLKKIPIRLRLTILCVLTLVICCLGLTAILNLSAVQMADSILATPLLPSTTPNANSDFYIAMPMVMPAATAQAARSSFFSQSIFFLLLVVFAGGGLTYYITGKALKPLKEFSLQIKSRTVHNLSDTFPIPNSNDEIADLTRSFNEMSDKLNEAFAMQKRFSQSAAHELRTPLTVLKTKVAVFQKKPSHTPEEYASLLSVIMTHTNRLADLVTDLLDLTNMDTIVCDEKIMLKELLSSVTKELAPLADSLGVTLFITGNEASSTGNLSLLRRAFFNLIENAIKYNHKGGSVTIQIRSVQDYSIITLTDTGIGIPSDLRPLIFEPFFRVDPSRSRHIGGSGLGLSIVKTIVETHKGEIHLWENPAGGSIFELQLKE